MNKIFIALLIIVFFASLNMAQNRMSGSLKNTYADSLTFELFNFNKKSIIPGFSVVVVDTKGILYSKGFGYAAIKTKTPFTPNTIQLIASISKTFMAFCIMKLVDEGKLKLDDPINAVLPFKIVNPHFPDIPITVRHIVTHTSGITDFFEPYYVGEADAWLVKDVNAFDYPEYMRININYYKMGKPFSLKEGIRRFTQPGAKWYSDSTFLKNEPGTIYQYSNLAAAIGALIVETKSGISYEAFTQQFIFNPLKMKNTAWRFDKLNTNNCSKIYKYDDENKSTKAAEYPHVYSVIYPSGGLLTTANDMANYLQEMIKGFAGKGSLLSPSSYQMLFAPQIKGVELASEDVMDKINNMGVYWFLSPDERVWHLGGNDGVASFLYFNKKTLRGAFAHCNLRDDGFVEILNIVKKYEQKMSRSSR